MAELSPLSHEDLLLWLHDHIGRVVGVSVIVEFSSMMELVLVAVPGTLRHHTSINPPGTELAGRSGDEIVTADQRTCRSTPRDGGGVQSFAGFALADAE